MVLISSSTVSKTNLQNSGSVVDREIQNQPIAKATLRIVLNEKEHKMKKATDEPQDNCTAKGITTSNVGLPSFVTDNGRFFQGKRENLLIAILFRICSRHGQLEQLEYNYKQRSRKFVKVDDFDYSHGFNDFDVETTFSSFADVLNMPSTGSGIRFVVQNNEQNFPKSVTFYCLGYRSGISCSSADFSAVKFDREKFDSGNTSNAIIKSFVLMIVGQFSAGFDTLSSNGGMNKKADYAVKQKKKNKASASSDHTMTLAPASLSHFGSVSSDHQLTTKQKPGSAREHSNDKSGSLKGGTYTSSDGFPVQPFEAKSVFEGYNTIASKEPQSWETTSGGVFKPSAPRLKPKASKKKNKNSSSTAAPVNKSLLGSKKSSAKMGSTPGSTPTEPKQKMLKISYGESGKNLIAQVPLPLAVTSADNSHESPIVVYTPAFLEALKMSTRKQRIGLSRPQNRTISGSIITAGLVAADKFSATSIRVNPLENETVHFSVNTLTTNPPGVCASNRIASQLVKGGSMWFISKNGPSPMFYNPHSDPRVYLSSKVLAFGSSEKYVSHEGHEFPNDFFSDHVLIIYETDSILREVMLLVGTHLSSLDDQDSILIPTFAHSSHLTGTLPLCVKDYVPVDNLSSCRFGSAEDHFEGHVLENDEGFTVNKSSHHWNGKGITRSSYRVGLSPYIFVPEKFMKFLPMDCSFGSGVPGILTIQSDELPCRGFLVTLFGEAALSLAAFLFKQFDRPESNYINGPYECPSFNDFILSTAMPSGPGGCSHNTETYRPLSNKFCTGVTNISRVKANFSAHGDGRKAINVEYRYNL